LREGKKEQEDLLVLLADQDTKLKAYRRRLKELGEKVRMLILGTVCDRRVSKAAVVT
jgi:Uso1 / p115 like vesicle tethering protein, C terminal region